MNKIGDFHESAFLISKQMFTAANGFVWLMVFVSPLLFKRRKPDGDFKLWHCFALLMCFFPLLLYSGINYPHRLIITTPILAVLAGVSSGILWDAGGLRLRGLIASGLLLCVSSFGYFLYKAHSLNYASRMNAPFEIAEFLNGRNVRGKYAYFTHNHISYWLTGTEIPTRFVHPQTVALTDFVRAYENNPGVSPTDELKSIFLKEPVFVVIRQSLDYFNDLQKEFIRNQLRKNYTLVKTVPDLYARKKAARDVLVYERKGVY